MIVRIFNHKFYFHYLACNETTFIVIIEYSELKMRIKQIAQKSDLIAKMSTS